MSRQRALPRIERGRPNPDDGRDGLLIFTPYPEDGWMAAVKKVPAGERRWLPHKPAWWIAAKHALWVRKLTMQYFGAYELIDTDGSSETHSPGATTRQERLI